MPLSRSFCRCPYKSVYGNLFQIFAKSTSTADKYKHGGRMANSDFRESDLVP